MNEWKQIHTNGATTTFARIYEEATPRGSEWVFQKLAADQVDGSAEMFGEERFGSREAADDRLREAVALAR